MKISACGPLTPLHENEISQFYSEAGGVFSFVRNCEGVNTRGLYYITVKPKLSGPHKMDTLY